MIFQQILVWNHITAWNIWNHIIVNSLLVLVNTLSTRLIDLVDRAFANNLGNLGLIPGHIIPKTLKMLLDTSLLNTQQ